jgi:hypothetical protein
MGRRGGGAMKKHIDDVLNAGRTLATLVEHVQIQGCGNAPPHADDCPDCQNARDAIWTWAKAVGRLRVAGRWQAGEPADPGLYLVSGRSSTSVRVAEMMGQQAEPRKLLGLVHVARGPRGGYRRPRWVGPAGRVTSWDDEWRWLRLTVEPLDAEAIR